MKISVAMATYNGEKYIKEQLDTILNQTVPVDEIIVSDDGSKDSTLDIVKSLNDPRIKIITGNPRPGYCGNFEYALKHTTGDIIFLADQDDIWMPEKVEENLRVFQEFPNIELVMTNGILIDKDGKTLDGPFNLHISEKESLKLHQDDYLSTSVYACLANGMCMCMKNRLLDSILPFPDSKVCHDRWIAFCAMLNDCAYYLNLPLVKYRIHDTNTSMHGNISLRQRYVRLICAAYHTPYDLYNIACAMLNKLIPTYPKHTSAINLAKQMQNDHLLQIEAINKRPIRCSVALFKLRRTNALYRSNGPKYFSGQLLLTFFGRRYIKNQNRSKCQF